MKKIVYIILIFSLFKTALSIDTLSTKYLPLHAGNIWVYSCSATGFCDCQKRLKVVANNPFVINGHAYYSFSTSSYTISCYPGSYGCTNIDLFTNSIRIDSTTGNIVDYTASGGCSWLNSEILEDSLKSRLGDTTDRNCYIISFYKCSDTNTITIFNMTLSHKTYSESSQSYYYFERNYTKGIGLTSTTEISGGPGTLCTVLSTLRGCVINSIVYGDTSTLVGIIPISSEVPEKFMLYQNYPNPFNPKTKIKFDLPIIPLTKRAGGMNVLLTIYDILGGEVATLVNDKLSPGIYEVEWDAGNYASGVYFYRITISDPETSSGSSFNETQRMVILR